MRTRVTIVDNDCVAVTMEADMTTVSESDTLLLIVRVDDNFDAAFTVSIASLNGSATSMCDHCSTLGAILLLCTFILCW